METKLRTRGANIRAIIGAVGTVFILGTVMAAIVAGDQDQLTPKDGVLSVMANRGLTQEQILKAQVQVLAEQLAEMQKTFAQCRVDASSIQAKLDSVVLTVQNNELKQKHEALEAEIKKALGGKDSDVVDWSTTPPTLKKP